MTEKNANFIADYGDFYKVDTSGGNITVTMPTAIGNTDDGLIFVNAGNNDILFTFVSGQTVNGINNFKIGARGYAELRSDGANFFPFSGSDYMVAPNGNIYRMTVDNTGTILTTLIT